MEINLSSVQLMGLNLTRLRIEGRIAPWATQRAPHNKAINCAEATSLTTADQQISVDQQLSVDIKEDK